MIVAACRLSQTPIDSGRPDALRNAWDIANCVFRSMHSAASIGLRCPLNLAAAYDGANATSQSFPSHVSEKRLSLTPNGNVRYQLKTPYRDGTRACPAVSGTHVIFERGGLPPLDFIARLAALVPKPRVNLTRFHGVFARGGLPSNSQHRGVVF